MNQLQYNFIRKERTCEKLGITEGQFAYVKRLGTIIRKLYENDCNGFLTTAGDWDERATKRNEAKTDQFEKRALKFAKDNKLHIYLQTDCRGATIYLDKKPIPENNYNNASCIY